MPEPFYAIDVEFDVPEKKDLALFVDCHKDPEHPPKDFFEERSLFDGMEHGLTLLRILSINALVIDKSVLDIPFAKFEPARRNPEIRVDLVVEASKARAASSKDLPNAGRGGTPRLDLKTQGIHQ